jgi:putative ABC transport system permease protein
VALAGTDGVDVEATKAGVLDEAERLGGGLTELFSTIGAFSVIAGILLLINLFVMLDEERKTELFAFREVGGFELKGIARLVTLFEALGNLRM